MSTLSKNFIIDMAANDPASLGITDRLRFLAKDSFIYGGAAALNKIFALITFPLLARHFSVVDYGLLDFFAFVAALLAIICVFGQDSAVARFFYETSDKESRQQIISQSLGLQLVSMCFLIPILWLFSGWVSSELHPSPKAEQLFRTVLLQIPFIVLIGFAQGILKWTFKRSSYLLVSLGLVTLNTALLVLGIFVYEVDVVGVLRIYLCAYVVFAIVGLYLIRQWLVVPDGYSFLLKLLPFAAPYGLICSVGAVVPLIERSVVSGLIGSEELGLYAAGAKVAMLMSLLVSSFQTGWGPFALSIHKTTDASQSYNLVVKGFTILSCVLVLALAGAGEIIVTLLASNRFAGSSIVVFPLAMGLAIQGIGWITEIGIGISKRSYLSLVGYAAFLGSTALGIYVLAAPFGFVGVAFGVLIGQATLALVSFWFAQRAHPLPWKVRPVVATVFATLVTGLLGQWVGAHGVPGYASLVYLAGALLVLGLGLLMNFSRQDIRKILGYLRHA